MVGEEFVWLMISRFFLRHFPSFFFIFTELHGVKEVERHLGTVLSVPPHPNVVTYSSWAKNADSLYLVSDFIPSSLMQAFLDSGCQGMSLTKRVDFATQIVAGMNWLHASNEDLIHGSLCPSTVCLGEEEMEIDEECDNHLFFFLSFFSKWKNCCRSLFVWPWIMCR